MLVISWHAMNIQIFSPITHILRNTQKVANGFNADSKIIDLVVTVLTDVNCNAEIVAMAGIAATLYAVSCIAIDEIGIISNVVIVTSANEFFYISI